MRLTHDKVRALRDATTARASCVTCEALLMPDRVSAPHCEDCPVSDEAEAEWEQLGFDDRDHGDVVRALAEEWLARRTVRWTNGDMLSMLGRFGTVRYDSKARSWVARMIGTTAGTDCARGTEDYVRAWLEAKAREAGLEVVT